MGPRMHQIVLFFFKTFLGEHAPGPPPLLAWLRAFCARMKILYVLNIASPTWNPGPPLKFYRYSVKHLGSRSGSTFCLV